MPWGWDARGPSDVAVGGSRGTPEEAAVAHAWPKYEADYLKNRLQVGQGKYDDGDLGEVERHIYLDKISHDYKNEADECLRAEFHDWLQGKHEDNYATAPYENGAGKPVRRKVFRDGKGSTVGEPWSSEDGVWRPTYWAKQQLTHLPGVREYLRNLETKSQAADLKMNLLAEFGPQDLDSAWMYFKHWVKARPVGPEDCPTTSLPSIGTRSNFGPQPPQPRNPSDKEIELQMPRAPPTEEQVENAVYEYATSDATDMSISTQVGQNLRDAMQAGYDRIGADYVGDGGDWSDDERTVQDFL